MSLLTGKAAIVLLFIASMLSPVANAEQKQELGEWDVHYMVVNTAFLTPEVAQAYDIMRSKYSALVNIAVLDNKTQKPLRLAVTGTATNLLGTVRQLQFKLVEEGDAIYYLATLPFRDREKYRFNIELRKGDNAQTLKFQQEMFVDD